MRKIVWDGIPLGKFTDAHVASMFRTEAELAALKGGCPDCNKVKE